MSADTGGVVAAIDCGTNSTRLLVVDGSGGSLTRQMRITRLGQGVDATHKLDVEAIERTLAVLSDFRRVMDDLGVVRGRMAATSAVRDATNGEDFLSAASEVTGVRAELLSGAEEGTLAYAGATADLAPAVGDDVVVDIGGGSTELVLERDGRIDAVSLDLGCVRLTERYLQHDPPKTEEIAGAVAAIGMELDRAVRTVAGLRTLRSESRLIGLAGTVSTLSALQQGLAEYDYGRLHRSVLTQESVAHWCDTLAAEPAETRACRPGMTSGRQDVLVGGALVLREVMVRLGLHECLVSETDILDGLIDTIRITST